MNLPRLKTALSGCLTRKHLDGSSFSAEVPHSDAPVLGGRHEQVFTMGLDLGDRLGVELENVFDGKSGGVVEFDLVSGGRDNEVVAVGSDVKDVNVAVGECGGLFEV